MGIAHYEYIQQSIEEDARQVVNVPVADNYNVQAFTGAPFDFNPDEIRAQAELDAEAEITTLPETKKPRAGISWPTGKGQQKKYHPQKSRGKPKNSVAGRDNPQRHIGFYPTKHWHPPLDSNASQESEGSSREPPPNDKLNILHLIRYKTTPKQVAKMKSLKPLAASSNDDSVESFKNGKIWSETLNHIMEMVNANTTAQIDFGGSGNVLQRDEYANYGYDPRTTHYLVSFIFLVYALILYVLFKFRVFRKIKVLLRG